MTGAELSALCGQLIVGGFDGGRLPPRFARALGRGERGGAILFRRNLESVEAAHALCGEIVGACPASAPPWIGVDEEGGRVSRLPSPVLRLPPMRTLAAAVDDGLLEEAGEVLGSQLAATGFSIDFAPVLDVDTNPANPVIGDRAFGATPAAATRGALCFARGLARHVVACGKHFPGHGDTDIDSHLALPVLRHDRERLSRVELAPFVAAVEAGLDALMSAHVVVEAFDPGRPATLSRTLCTDLLRGRMGFRGVLFSDDLEMNAVATSPGVASAAVSAIAAGCDVVLICRDEAAQEEALAALIRQCESSLSFRGRCEEALGRGLAARRRRPPAPATRTGLDEALRGPRAERLREALARATGAVR